MSVVASLKRPSTLQLWRLSLSDATRRPVSTSPPVLGDNPEWRRARRDEKERRERAWTGRRRANPFARNVGLARRLHALDVGDPEDPAFKLEDGSGPPDGVDPALHAENIADDTAKGRYNLHGKAPALGQSAYAIMLKKRFSGPKDPDLLTWSERQVIAHLHAEDPATWTVERLAESYPATEEVIRRYSRKKNTVGTTPKIIRKIDGRVRENWAKLAAGKLEMSEALSERLDKVGIDSKAARARLKKLDSGEAREMEERMLEENRKLLEAPPTQVKCGEFGEILRSYQVKVEAKEKRLALAAAAEKPEEKQKSLQGSVEVRSPGLFDPQSEFQPGSFGDVPSPYRDTALVNAKDDGFGDRNMTAEEFKDRSLRKESKFSSWIGENERSPVKAAYREWVEEELAKDDAASKVQRRLTAEEVLVDREALYSPVSKYSAVETEDDGEWEGRAVKIDSAVKPGLEYVPDKIDIPRDKYRRGAIYESNKCFYDDGGNFLYRVPVETMQ